MGNKIKTYKIKIKPIKYLIGGVCCLSSFIIPDLSFGLVLGLMIINPIPLKYQLKQRFESLGGDTLKLKVVCGWYLNKFKRRVSRVLNSTHLDI